MKKILAIILLVIMLTGCTTYKRYYEDKPISIIGVELVANLSLIETNDSYKYKYTIEIFTKDTGFAMSAVNEKAYMFSNKRYGMGDIIWMGARWGRKYNKDVDLDSN